MNEQVRVDREVFGNGENLLVCGSVMKLPDEIRALAGDSISGLGTGGMATKLKAAGIVTEAGIDMVIANGEDPAVLYDLFDGKAVGTRFAGRK